MTALLSMQALPTNTQVALCCVAKITVTHVAALEVDTLAVFRTVKQGGVLAFINI